MGKLLKYELKGMYKFIILVLLTIVGSSAIMQGTFYYMSQNPSEFNGDVKILIPFLFGISILVIIAAYLVSFFYIVNCYNKELVDDRGYLTFSLPIKARQILGAKVWASFIAFFLIFLITGLFNFILGMILVNKAGINIYQEFLKLDIPAGLGKYLLIFSVYSLISSILNLIMIFFVMTLRKVLFGGRKFNFIWFIFYVILNGFFSYFSLKAIEICPYFITVDEIGRFAIQNADVFNGIYNNVGFPPILNIGVFIFSIICGIVLFIITSLLLDKKVEI